jgi:acetyl esterase/lipase
VDNSTGIGVIVCPGGGFNYLATDIEGAEICDWLNTVGVTGILLKYRVPAQDRPPRRPLQDIQRTLGIVRHNAKQWGIDSHKIGVIGFSAGANLSALLSADHATRSYAKIDDSDMENCRPDFQLLIYPGGMVAQGNELRPEFAVTTNTPPTFIVQAENDPVRVENAIAYTLALKRAGVPAEFHMYADGGHGFGLRRTGLPVADWPERAAEWIKRHEVSLPQTR